MRVLRGPDGSTCSCAHGLPLFEGVGGRVIAPHCAECDEEARRGLPVAEPGHIVTSPASPTLSAADVDRIAEAVVARLRTLDSGREQKLRDLAAKWRRWASAGPHVWDAVCLRGFAEEVLRVLDPAPGAQGDAGGGPGE